MCATVEKAEQPKTYSGMTLMTLRTDQLLRSRGEIEKKNYIKIGRGQIVYNVKDRGWALPGGMLTAHRASAERAAQLIDLIMRGEIKGPYIARDKNEKVRD